MNTKRTVIKLKNDKVYLKNRVKKSAYYYKKGGSILLHSLLSSLVFIVMLFVCIILLGGLFTFLSYLFTVLLK